ncbi:MAG: two pore domain potassium channel family protein [Alphaproteobacteria bacterium]|nr:two pore domain potassium channel family protein [Alphaproteobacteria bacterium]
MILQLVVGSLVIAVIVAIQAEMFSFLSNRIEDLIRFERRWLHRFANTGVIISAVLYILLVHTISVWIWAIVFIVAGAFAALEPALYFAVASYTTVGYGDIILEPNWRLLSGLTAANGFLCFGWSTAYMVELVRRTA